MGDITHLWLVPYGSLLVHCACIICQHKTTSRGSVGRSCGSQLYFSKFDCCICNICHAASWNFKTALLQCSLKVNYMFDKPLQTQMDSRVWGTPDHCGQQQEKQGHSGRCLCWSPEAWHRQLASLPCPEVSLDESSSSHSTHGSSLRKRVEGQA